MSGWAGLDLAVLLLYMLGVIALGARLGRGAAGGRDYFLGGRDLPWGAVLLSIVATETSTLTFLSVPGVAYAGSLAFLQLSIGYIVGRAVVAWWLLPSYHAGEMATAYEALESRFGLSTRKLTSAIFMVTRTLADSVRLFATAIPLALLTGWSYPLSVIVIGIATLLYTWAGGIRAVVWVDAIQMVLYLVGGLAALVILGGLVSGGWPAILETAGSAGKLEVFDFRLDPAIAYTFWAGLIGGAFLSMGSHGTDQLIVQRLLACKDLRSSRRALIGSGFAVLFQFVLFLLVGIGLWVHFGGASFERGDEIFPRFILAELPVGLRGLLIAAVFAAAMSSLSSSINSLASASTYDFWSSRRRASDESGTDAAALRAGRMFTLLWGTALIGAAIAFIPLSSGSTAVEVSLGIASLVYGGLLGAFALARFVPSAHPRSVQLAIVLGIGTVTVVWAAARDVVAWPWFVCIGTVVTFLAGALPRRRSRGS